MARLFAGIDSGAATVKTVIINGGNETLTSNVISTGGDALLSAKTSFNRALEEIGVSKDDIEFTIATGYGRKMVPFAGKAITEIICHARGGKIFYPDVRTIIDIGGQDSKVIGMDEEGTGSQHNLNYKCAAGTGRFLEVMADVLEVGIDGIGPLSLKGKKPCHISSTCTVFAESEVVTHRAKKEKTENILAGIHESIAKRVVSMGIRVGYNERILFTGGVAKNCGVHKALEKEIGKEITIPRKPQIIGALGAALYAKEECERK